VTWDTPDHMPDMLDRIIAHGAKSPLVKQDWLNRYMRTPEGQTMPEPHRQALRDLGYTIRGVGPSWPPVLVQPKILPSRAWLRAVRSPSPAHPPYAVFCIWDEEEADSVIAFTHEATLMLMALGSAVERGEMTDAQAFESFSPYRHLARWVYNHSSVERWGGFPIFGEDVDYDEGPGLDAFINAVNALNVPGVGWDSSPIYSNIAIRGDEALDRVSARLRRTYCIEPLNRDEFDEGQTHVEQAKRLIAEARHRCDLADRDEGKTEP